MKTFLLIESLQTLATGLMAILCVATIGIYQLFTRSTVNHQTNNV